MKRIFTVFLSVWAVIAFVSAPAAGQEYVELKAVESSASGQNAELRAAVATDSTITCNLNGDRVYKTVRMQDGDLYSEKRFRWENNRWIEDESVPSVILWTYTGKLRVQIEEGELRFTFPSIDGWMTVSWDSTVEYTAVKDNRGNLTSLKVGKNDLFNIQYDEFDRLVSIDEYFNGTKSIQVRYAYDLDGRKYAGDLCMSLFEYEEWDYEKQTWRAGRFRRKVRKHAPVDYPDGGVSSRILTHEEYVADASGKWVGDKKYDMAYDSNGKRSIMYHYVWYGNRWTQIQYTVYYPNSYTSSVTPGNNNPVGNTDKGGFDIRITLPADSIAAGSFVVRLPDGFSLDKDNSALTTGFNDFVLGITKQEDNSWLFTVKPKDTRSAALLSGEAVKTLAHVAYTVDGEVKRGTYDITVHSIRFETPGGESIVEPAITVPARLNRWGVASEVIDVSPSQAWSHNGLIHVHSGRPQQVAVYSLSGAKLYEGHVQAGTAALSGLRLPKGLYIIILADGESLKVPVD